jgi:hypothetical protein
MPAGHFPRGPGERLRHGGAAGTAAQHHDYQAWSGNDRRLPELLASLEVFGAAAFEADPRWDR